MYIAHIENIHVVDISVSECIKEEVYVSLSRHNRIIIEHRPRMFNYLHYK